MEKTIFDTLHEVQRLRRQVCRWLMVFTSLQMICFTIIFVNQSKVMEIQAATFNAVYMMLQTAQGLGI